MKMENESRINSYTNNVKKTPYQDYVFEMSPKSSHFKNLIWAFLIGGLICTVGQVIIELFVSNGTDPQDASTYASCILVVAAAIATGLGIYDRLGRFAGAGATVPITGFSNAIVAPAIEFKSEGMIYGLGANMFKIAGPVIVNGVMFSFLIAIIYWVFGL